jgi:hypothetical protein
LKRGGALDIAFQVPGATFIDEARVQGVLRQGGFPFLLPYGANIAKEVEPVLFTSHDLKVRELMPHITKAQPWLEAGSGGKIPTVRGEVWAVPDCYVGLLDRIECVGRRPDGSVSPAVSLYLPVWITAHLRSAEEKVTCLAYAFNVLNGIDTWNRYRPVPDGNFSNETLIYRRLMG